MSTLDCQLFFCAIRMIASTIFDEMLQYNDANFSTFSCSMQFICMIHFAFHCKLHSGAAGVVVLRSIQKVLQPVANLLH